MIYLDSAATTFQKPPAVGRAMTEALASMSSPGRGGHPLAMRAADTAFRCRTELAELFGLDGPEGVAFTLNATHALNIAIKSLVPPGGRVVISGYEHNAVTRPLTALKAKVSVAGGPLFDQEAAIRAFDELIAPGVDVVICNHVSNVFGFVQPVEKVAALCRSRGVPLIVDASQSAGILPINMKSLGAAYIAMPGHKGLYGPQGTGGICVRPGITVRPLKSGGSGIHTYLKEHPHEMPTALEAGTLNGHGVAGLHAALGFLKETGTDTIHKKEIGLMRRFLDGIKDIPGLKLYGDFSTDQRAAVVALNLGTYDSSEVSDELSFEYGISTRPGAHCAPLMHQSMGTVDQGMVRFSFSWFNTEEEIDAAVKALKELAE